MPPPCIPIIYMVWCTLQCGIKLLEKKRLILVSEIKKTSKFLLNKVTNEPNLFRSKLRLKCAEINLFKSIKLYIDSLTQLLLSRDFN